MRNYIIGLAAASLLPSISHALSPGSSPNPAFLSSVYIRESARDENECWGEITRTSIDRDVVCYESLEANTQCVFGLAADELVQEIPDELSREEQQDCICGERRDQYWVGSQKCSDCLKKNGAPEGEWLGPDFLSSMSDAYCGGSPTQGFISFKESWASSQEEVAATATSGWTEGTAEPMSSQGLAAAMPTGIDHGLLGAAGVAVAAILM